MLAAGGIAGPGTIGDAYAEPQPDGGDGMRKALPVEDLARDERFVRVDDPGPHQRPRAR